MKKISNEIFTYHNRELLSHPKSQKRDDLNNIKGTEVYITEWQE